MLSFPVFKIVNAFNLHIQFFLASPVLLNKFSFSSMSFQVMNVLPYIAKLYNSDYNDFVVNYEFSRKRNISRVATQFKVQWSILKKDHKNNENINQIVTLIMKLHSLELFV